MRALGFLVLVAACNPYDDNFGETPFLCGASEPRCPEGYSCAAEAETNRAICIRGEAPDFACNDDSAREPNEDTSAPTVFESEIAASAICPDGDVDVYTVTLADVGTVELLVTLGEGAPLVAQILNTGGVPIATAAPIEDGNPMLRAVATDLDAGEYFARVAGPETGALLTNNYAIAVNVQ